MELRYIEEYNKQINPNSEQYIDNEGKKKTQWNNTRADKETRYHMFGVHKTTGLFDKERWSIELIKMALQKSKRTSLSCSFGIDSVVDIYLTRKALIELGRDPSDIDIVWNDTANEFREVRLYAKKLVTDWNLRLFVTKPEKTLKHIIDDNGGITSDYFTARKGDRRHGRPLSERCCGYLKHDPMKRITKKEKWDLLIVGLRADESSQRLRAGLRDGEYFYSIAEWKANVCRPILWWTEEDVWDYVKKENIPYNDLYKNNLIQHYPEKTEEIVFANRELIESLGLDYYELGDRQTQTVDRWQAIQLEKMGFKIFTPRTGCQMCPIPVKYGYMQWMRLYYPKTFDAMVHNLGYGKVLLEMIPNDIKEEIKMFTGIDVNEENAHTYLQEILTAKPCTFDKF